MNHLMPKVADSGDIAGSPGSEGCQLKCVPGFDEKNTDSEKFSLVNSIKRVFALPWNRDVKRLLKKGCYWLGIHEANNERLTALESFRHTEPLSKGDRVKVRSIEEINMTLDPFNELKGCSFLKSMQKYCGTEQTVLKSMNYFMDERDYKRKRTKGLILLENIICDGTPVFGSCDRCCFLFWREEWLEKL
jgi:hypothetical protein